MVVVVVMVVMVVMRTGAKHPRAVVPIVAVLQIPAPAMVMMVVMMMVMGGDKLRLDDLRLLRLGMGVGELKPFKRVRDRRQQFRVGCRDRHGGGRGRRRQCGGRSERGGGAQQGCCLGVHIGLLGAQNAGADQTFWRTASIHVRGVSFARSTKRWPAQPVFARRSPCAKAIHSGEHAARPGGLEPPTRPS